MFQFKKTQKFRLIIDNVSVYTTAGQIRNGIGDQYKCNSASQQALLVLGRMQDDNIPPCGIVGRWEGMNVQIDKMK